MFVKNCKRRSSRVGGWVVVTISLLMGLFSSQTVAAPAEPRPDATHGNIFYGDVLVEPGLPADTHENGPVILFVHGLAGNAYFWWRYNRMYDAAYNVGARTAFVSLNEDNSANRASIADNAEVLKVAIPHIADHFGVDSLYVVGHSKGGVDIQGAMVDPVVSSRIKGVFTISTPNQGTALADWLANQPALAAALNLDNPAVRDLETEKMAAFRSRMDPILRATGVPFYTIAGNTFEGHPITEVTGPLLRLLAPCINVVCANDGLVTVADTKLPQDYSSNLGTVRYPHFYTDSGAVSFPKIWSRILGLEIKYDEFERITAGDKTDGFGLDPHSSWIWSAHWFNGKLYVGTGREVDCVSTLISDKNINTNLYPLRVLVDQCPTEGDLMGNLAAEIWQYSPDTDTWARVFLSPTIDVDGQSVGREIGFRGLEVHEESDGTLALYAGSVTAGSLLDPIPFDDSPFPPPRLLRTVDGVNWQPVPQTPGTFLGDIGGLLLDERTRVRGFRSLKSMNGWLLVSASDYIGSGIIIGSQNPSAGDDTFAQVSPARDEMPVWTLYEFNDLLYVAAGLTVQQDETKPGYSVFKAAVEGTPPFEFTEIISEGGYQSEFDYRSPNGLSFAEFNGQLYMGTNRPTELIRINPDDSWELVVGEPRTTPDGDKYPTSGFGFGFAHFGLGHFWRMGVYDGQLYLGTWDWTVAAQNLNNATLDALMAPNYGFDLFRTSDGDEWTAITRSGLGRGAHIGIRSVEPTPEGLFIGTASNLKTAGQVYLSSGPETSPEIAPPAHLFAAPIAQVGRNVSLTWQAVAGATRYRVYRALTAPLADLFGGGGSAAAVQPGDEMDPLSLQMPYQLVAVTTDLFFEEPAPTDQQTVYFVRAENADGTLSTPSNIVAAPSKAEWVVPPVAD